MAFEVGEEMGDPGLSEERGKKKFGLVAGVDDRFVSHFCWHTWMGSLDIRYDVRVEELCGHVVGGRAGVADGFDVD